MTDSRGPKRTPFQRESDYLLITEQYLKGKTQARIAQEIGVDRSQVGKDLKLIRARWKTQSFLNLTEVTTKDLAKLDLLEKTYWEAWERSIKPRQVNVSHRPAVTGLVDLTVTREERDGNPSFLAGVLTCIDRRCKLLGLDGTQEIDLTFYTAYAEKLAKELGLDPARLLAEAQRIIDSNRKRGR